jgi:hypothetical protein
MRTLRMSALGLAALLATTAGASSISTSGAAALAPTGLLPPQLQALELKMEQLQLNSERFSRVTQGRITVTNEVNGKPVGRSEHILLDGTELGEASLSPAAGEAFLDGKHRPSLIAIGPSLYKYEASRKGARRHPPWVRSSNPTASPAAYILPFQGGSPLEVHAGGTGSFAGLINLLTTSVGPVTLGGAAVVQGQPTTEFTAAVEPRLLIKGLTREEFANFEKEAPIESLQLFLTESGLPVRVVSTIRTKGLESVNTTEILALNVPVTVKRPPTRETIARTRLRDRRVKEGNGGFAEVNFTPAALRGAQSK